MARLKNLEWVRFTYDGDTWRLILTTPLLAPSFCKSLRNGKAVAECVYEAKAIYFDAGDDELEETVHHEFHHIGRDDYGDEDHKFFMATSPVVVSIYNALGIKLLPPLPEGYERLRRSSKRWHAKKEWSA